MGSARVYAGQALDERLAERRERFINAGIQQFGTVGFHATTVRSLCAEAGLANRYFYESFGSIEALLIACYQTLMAQLRERLLAETLAAPGGSLNGIAVTGARCFFEAVRDPIFARLTLLEVFGVSPVVDQVYLENARAFATVMISVPLLSEQIAKIPTEQVEMAGIALVGAFAYAGLHWARGGYAVPIESMIQLGLQILMGTVTQMISDTNQAPLHDNVN